MPKFWSLWAVIAAAVLLAWLAAAPPAPRPANAAPTAFSAERAMADVRLLGAKPHPIGSAEHAAVSERIVARLTALGLSTQVITGAEVRATDDGFVGADIENIAGVLPGTDPGLPALALMAHYDSVAGSPGAADDTAGVASILETVRALKARGPQARDVIVLITDGEETGLFGATSFWREQPLARRIGLLVNLEARGSSGPAFMFETGPDNAGAMRLYGDVVARPEASSLSGWVYDRMPNGTDFTIPKKLGITGFNIAMIGTPFDYHSPSATPGHLDRGSLQHMGDQTLALADALARARAAPKPGPDLVYSEIYGRFFVAYPAWAGWLLLGIAALLIVYTIRAQGLPVRKFELARGAGLFPLVLFWPALIAHVAYRIAPVGEDFYQSPTVAQYGLFFAGMALLSAGVALGTFGTFLRGALRWLSAGLAVGLGVLCSLLGGFDMVGTVLAVGAAIVSALVLGPKPEPKAAGQGLLLMGLILATLLQILAPDTAYVIAWPLLAASIAAALFAIGKGPRLLWSLLAAIVTALALGWTLRMTGFLFDGLGLTNPELLGLFAALAALLLAPFILSWVAWGKGGHWSAFAFNLSGILLLAYVALHSPWSARTPAPSHVLYVANQDTGQARIVSLRDKLDPWSRDVLTGYGQVRQGRQPTLFADTAWWAEAGPANLTDAERVYAAWVYPVPIRVSPPGGSDPSARANGEVSAATLWNPENAGLYPQNFVVRTPAGTRDLKLTLTFSSDAEVSTTVTPSFKGAAKAGKPYRARWYTGEEQPIGVIVRPKAPHGSVLIQWAALRDGWPAGARPLPRRPADVMATGSSDATVITGQTRLRW